MINGKIGIGLIGCGTIARVRHAPEYAANPACRLVGCHDVSRERADSLARDFGCTAFDTAEALLADPRVDAVSICTANGTHAAMSIQALGAGRHVLCEKPMATSTRDAREMIETAGRADRILMIGHNQRFLKGHRKAHDLLRSGMLGRVLSFRTLFTHAGPDQWVKDRTGPLWFFDPAIACFGCGGDLGIHKADLVQWLLGDPVVEVGALAATRHKTGADGRPIALEDTLHALLRTAGGIPGTLEAGWTNYGPEENATIFFCENGVLRLYEQGAADVVWQGATGETAEYHFHDRSTNERQLASGVIDAFISSIADGKEPPVTGQDGYGALAVIEACIRSSGTGRREVVETL